MAVVEGGYDSYFSGPIGRIIRGIIKIALASAVWGLLVGLQGVIQDISISNSTIPVSMMFNIILGFAPLLLVMSGLRDMGVKL